MADFKKPVFSPDAAEEYFSMLLTSYRDTANDIFRRDNEGRHASEQHYSAEYQKYVGMQIAMREVLEYFGKFDLGDWVPTKERTPTDYEDEVFLVIANGKPNPNVTLIDAVELAEYDPEDGWILDAYPEWEKPWIKYWKPIKLPYEEELHGTE